jgi:regulator of protease activity HflC (stomatin/prohibitin superfamily)
MAATHITPIMNTEALLYIIAPIALGLTVRATWKRFVNVTEVPMHHRCLHSRHGRLVKLLEPGHYRVFGSGHQFQHFDSRLQQIALQTQELTTAEGITVKITAVGLYRIIDPVVAVSATADFNGTLYTLIQLALRDGVNGIDVESLLSNVRSLGPKLLDVVKDKAANLGLELTELVVRDVIVPSDIKAALSETWRSKKSALAEIESARGKAAAARTLANAAQLYETHPALLKVRYIEALEQASKGMGNTFVIGMSEDKALKTI